MTTPISEKLRETCRLAREKGLRVETIGRNTGRWIYFPPEINRPRLRIPGVVSFIEFVEKYQP